jgi:adhesin/invasin
MMLFFIWLQTAFISATVQSAISFVAGPPIAAECDFSSAPNSVVADGVTTSFLIFNASDFYGNRVPGISISLSTSGSNNTFGAVSGVTDANGIFTTTLSSTVAQSENITISFSNQSLSIQQQFVPGPASLSRSSFVTNPSTQIADNNSIITGTLTLLDGQNNPISGVTPNFTASGSSNVVGGGGPTSSSGKSIATYRTSVAQNENAQVSAAGISYSMPIVFSAGPPTASNSSLIINPNIVTADNANTATLFVTARDAQGNASPGRSVSFAASGGNNTFGSITGITDASGQLITTLASPTAQNENITATINSNVIQSASVSFVPGPASVTTSTLYVSPVQQIADNTRVISGYLTLRDAQRNTIAGTSTVFSGTGANISISSAVATDPQGMAVGNYKTNVVQQQNIVVSAGGITLSKPVLFSDVPAQCILTANPNTQTADGNSAITLTTQVTNSSNQNIKDVFVSYTSTGAAQNFNTISPVTTSAGLSISSLKSLYKGQNTIIAQAANVQCLTTARFIGRTGYCSNTPQFTSAMYTPDDYPAGLIATDFDMDGRLDLAVSTLQGVVSVFLQNSAGAFSPKTSFPTLGSNQDLVTADVNSDGFPDIIAANQDGNFFSVLLGIGGGFRTPVRYPVGPRPSMVIIDDFDGDGAADIVSVNSNDGTFSFCRGIGDGTFMSARNTNVGGSPYYAISGDFDGDGLKDLAMTFSSSSQVATLFGQGNGNFLMPSFYAKASAGSGIVVGDFNGDGIQDLSCGNSLQNGNIQIYMGLGGRALKDAMSYGLGSGPAGSGTWSRRHALGDFNGDGKQDIITANFYGGDSALLLGAGDGNFIYVSDIVSGGQPSGIAVGDFNSDGYQDFALSDYGSTRLRVFLYSGCQ